MRSTTSLERKHALSSWSGALEAGLGASIPETKGKNPLGGANLPGVGQTVPQTLGTNM